MVLIADRTWEESSDFILLHVFLRKPFRPEHVDIYISSSYCKVNCHRQFFEVDLFADIDPEASEAVISENGVDFKLRKSVSDLIWTSLEYGGEKYAGTDQEQRLQRRQLSIQKELEATTARLNAKKQEKGRLHREAFEKQWELERVRRQEIEQRKEEERRRAIREMFSSTSTNEIDDESDDETDARAIRTSSIGNTDSMDRVTSSDGSENISTEGSRIDRSIFEDELKVDECKSNPLPIRGRGDSRAPVRVHFTPKDFSHLPTRDRQYDDPSFQVSEEVKEENRRKTDVTEALWLKNRGDTLYRNRDFSSSLAAFDASLEKCKTLQAMSNRSACLLQLGRYADCIEECNEILRILETSPDNSTPDMRVMVKKVEDPIKLRIHAYTRRGAAFSHCGNFQRALRDFEGALSQLPHQDPFLYSDYCAIRTKIGDEDKPEITKENADTLFRLHDYDGAIIVYSELIQELALKFGFPSPSDESDRVVDWIENLSSRNNAETSLDRDPESTNILEGVIQSFRLYLILHGNRSVCSLSLRRDHDCFRDVEFVIRCLDSASPHFSSLRLPSLLLKSLVRRGTLFALHFDIRLALPDYQRAAKLSPSDVSLSRDTNTLAEAVSNLNRAESLVTSGLQFENSGAIDRAHICFEESAARSPFLLPALFHRTRSRWRTNSFSESRSLLSDLDYLIALLTSSVTLSDSSSSRFLIEDCISLRDEISGSIRTAR